MFDALMLAYPYAFAAKAHEGVKRRGGEDYIIHPEDVLEIVSTVPWVTYEMKVAALLHDVVEDTDVTLAEIHEEFGEKVAQLVDELTKKPVEGNRATRTEAEAQRLAGVSREAQTIKYADIISNLKDIDEVDPRFAKKYKAEKQRALMLMTKGHEALRQQAWLLTL